MLVKLCCTVLLLFSLQKNIWVIHPALPPNVLILWKPEVRWKNLDLLYKGAAVL